MNPAIIITVLNLIASVVPEITSSAKVAQVVAMLVEILPKLIEVATDLVQPVKNIILALQQNGATTQELMDQLKALDAQCDSAFEAAAVAAEAQDSQQ